MTVARAQLAGLVLAAGRGDRLRPLTDLRPKPLCPVGDATLLDAALDRVRPHVGALAVNAHHLADQVVAHVADRAHLSVETPAALGTAGAVGALRGWTAGRHLLVHNGDTYLEDDLARLLDGWDGRRPRVLVRATGGADDFGSYRFVGASLLPAAVAARLPAEPAGLYEVVWRDAYAAGALELVETSGEAIDCGTPPDYLRANLRVSGGASVVGRGARVEGELVRSVVWPGASVAAGERLVECIRATDTVTVPAPLGQRDRHRRDRHRG